ncbi:MAG: hypothetical protein HKM02_07380 [Pseudomonadales bacterium]|nr:hypothetical protein [Pseudomonadales bacterium]
MRLPNTVKTRTLLLASALALTACGGGGSGASSSTGTLLTGGVIDAPIANAVVTFTLGAPLNEANAQVLGTITADGQGQYSIQVTFPNTSAPVFANAVSPDGQVVLTSYLGQASSLLSASTLNPTSIPDLDISQVSTAALALYVSQGKAYSNLTPALYTQLLSTYHNDILPLAASIQAVADGICNHPGNFKDTNAMAINIALNGASSTVLSSASATLPGCETHLQSLMQSIPANATWAPEFEQGDFSVSAAPSFTGSYSLQGLIAETGLLAPNTTSTTTSTTPVIATTPAPAEVFLDSSIIIDTSGHITSTDKSVSGTLNGRDLILNITDSTGHSYSLNEHMGTLASSMTSGGQAYSLSGAGVNTSSQILTRFDAVLAPNNVLPNWTGLISASDGSNDGLNCSHGAFGVHLLTTGPMVGGISLGACVTPDASGLVLTPSALNVAENELMSMAITNNVFTSLNLNEPLSTGSTASATPFVVTGQATFSFGITSYSGSLTYVLGSREMFYTLQSSTAGTMPLVGSIAMNNNPLDQRIDH